MVFEASSLQTTGKGAEALRYNWPTLLSEEKCFFLLCCMTFLPGHTQWYLRNHLPTIPHLTGGLFATLSCIHFFHFTVVKIPDKSDLQGADLSELTVSRGFWSSIAGSQTGGSSPFFGQVGGGEPVGVACSHAIDQEAETAHQNQVKG